MEPEAPFRGQVFTVTAITLAVKQMMEGVFRDVFVEGEVSNLREAASGHVYFDLKDREALLSAVMFKWDARKYAFELQEGVQVRVWGSLSCYANMAHGRRYYDYVANELPEIMRGMFPLSDKREDNFIAGLSMGGAGCMKIGLANPDKYGAIGCFSAGAINRHKVLSPERADMMNMVYGTTNMDDLNGTVEDVFGSAKKIVEEGLPCPRIFHSIGASDGLLESAHETRDFFTAIPGNPFDYHYEEHPGAHTWEYWDEHIQDFLRFLNLDKVKDIRN